MGIDTNYKIIKTEFKTNSRRTRIAHVGLCNLDAVAACREIRTLRARVPEIDIRIWTECAQRDAKPGVMLTWQPLRLRRQEARSRECQRLRPGLTLINSISICIDWLSGCLCCAAPPRAEGRCVGDNDSNCSSRQWASRIALPKAEKRHPSRPDKCPERERLALRALDGASYKEKGFDALKGSVIPD